MSKTARDTDGTSDAPRKRPEAGTGWDAVFRGYVNLEITADQKDAYQAWSESASYWDVFETVVGDGVNITVRYEPKSKAFMGSATQRRVGSPNAGLVVTARGGSPSLAFGRLLYCLAILGHRERWEDTQKVSDPDRW